METGNRKYSFLIILVFLAWILVPVLNELLHFNRSSNLSKIENRLLARKPSLLFSFLDPYPAAYEQYYDDHFVFREQLLTIYTQTVLHGFRRSPVPAAVDLGKEGWYFNSRRDKQIYMGKQNLSSDKIMRVVEILRERERDYRKRGIRFYVCFPPMSQEVYPEYLPNNYYRSPAGTQTDRIVALLSKDTALRFIPLKGVMLEAKKQGQVYQKTDHHWNTIGAFYAYRAIIERIRHDFPAIRPVERKDVKFSMVVRDGGMLSWTVGNSKREKEYQYNPIIAGAKGKDAPKAGYPPPSWFSFKDLYELQTVTPDSSLPKLLVIRDSFFTLTMPFFRENFSRMTVIWDAWQYLDNLEIIDKEKPDAVLLMIVEPFIPELLKYSELTR